jgi:hypothetical protein
VIRRILAAGVVLALAAAAGCDLPPPGPRPTPTPSSTVTANPSPTPTASPAPTDSASPSPTHTVAPAGWPTPETTGVPAGTALTGDAPCTLTGGTWVAKRWTCRVEVSAPGVVIRNSELLAGIQVNGAGSFLLEDSTVGPASGCVSGEAMRDRRFTARRVEVRNFTDGARSEGPNVVVEDSYFLLRECSSADHGDGLQGCQAPHCSGTEPNTNVRFIHNTVDQPSGEVLDGITANIFWSDGSHDGLVVQDNLLAGGAGTIRLLAGGNHVVTGNRIVDGSWHYWPQDISSCSTTRWEDNRLVTIDEGYSVASVGAVLPCVSR